jgi:hypothetical protein
MASRWVTTNGETPSAGGGRRVLCAVATCLATAVALAVVAAPAAAGVGSPEVVVSEYVEEIVSSGARPESAERATTPVADGRAVDGREIGVPLALLAGVGLFLLLSSQAGGHASKLTDAPLRPAGALRFPEAPG